MQVSSGYPSPGAEGVCGHSSNAKDHPRNSPKSLCPDTAEAGHPVAADNGTYPNNNTLLKQDNLSL